MDIHNILDRVFYKTDKKTGERKVSCCKLIIVVFVIFIIIGLLTGSSSNDSNQTANDSNSSIDMMKTLEIEPFAEDTVVSVGGESFTIPAGYGEYKDARSETTDENNGIITHSSLYIYENENLSQISIGYISQENIIMDDSFLSDEGSLKTIGGHEGKLNYEDERYIFNFIENGNSYTVYAPTEKDIEMVLS